MVEYVWKRSGREQRRGADTHRAHRFLPSPIVERAGVKSTVMLSLKKTEAGATASVALSLPRPVSMCQGAGGAYAHGLCQPRLIGVRAAKLPQWHVLRWHRDPRSPRGGAAALLMVA
jgi:hypothetical protein